MGKIVDFIKNNKYYVLLFISFLLLCFFFPYSGDDFAWGTQIGLDRLSSFFYNYNGRYSGNLLILVLTRCKFIRVILESLSFLFIVIVMNKIVDKYNKINKLLTIVLFLLMPVTIFRESISWASGFANYVLPIILILNFINYNKSLLNKKAVKNKDNSIVRVIIFLIISFVGSLFIENITLYNLFISIVVLIVEKKRTKHISLANFFYSFGSLIGTIFMFSNKAYLSIFNKEDTYRSVAHDNIIIHSIKTYFKDLYSYIFDNNLVVWIVLCFLLIILALKYINNNKKSSNKCVYIFLSFVVLFLVRLVYLNLPGNNPIFQQGKFNLLLNGVSGILVMFSIIGLSYKCISDVYKSRKIIFYVLSIAVVNAPLLLLTPIGPRLFLTTYVFCILIILELVDYLFVNSDNYLITILKIVVVILMFFYCSIYYSIWKMDKIQWDYINEVNGKQDLIYLPILPNANYIHCPNPVDETFMYRYKLFHNIDDDVQIVYLTYEEWLQKK